MTTPPKWARHGRSSLAVVVAVALAASTAALALATPASAEPTGSTATTIVSEDLATAGSSAGQRTWTYRDTGTAAFSTLGVSWAKGSVDPEVELRTRSADGWSAWTSSVETVATPEEADRAGTDPIYVGRSDGVEVRLTTTGSPVQDPQVSLIDVGTATTPTAEEPAAARMSTRAAAPARPAVITRKQWGANESYRSCTPRSTGALQAAIVHHTAGINSYSRSESAGIVRGIYAYHTRTLGWCDVGYNLLIDKYGQIFEGRTGSLDKPILGAHATSWNADTVGVSFLGNYETAAAPAAMMESGARVIAWKLGQYGRDPKGRVTLAGKTINRIAGHGDVMSTACPGRNVRSRMPALRDRVAVLMKGASSTPTTSPKPTTPPAATTAIGKRWEALGGAKGFLGWPVAEEKKVAGGTWREYRKHDMFDSSRTDPYWTTGSVRDRYRQLGTAGSALGFPTSDKRINWPVTNAWGNTFQNGAIVGSRSGGTRAVTGDFWKVYSSDRALQKRLWVPRDEATRSGFGTMSQTFSNGRMFDNGGVKVMEGRIYAHWTQHSGSGRLHLGQPTANATTVTASRTGTRATLQRLTKSTYVVVGTRTVAVRGSLHRIWRDSGAEKSRLGLPTTDERRTSTGWTQSFERGSISLVRGDTVIRYR